MIIRKLTSYLQANSSQISDAIPDMSPIALKKTTKLRKVSTAEVLGKNVLNFLVLKVF